MSNPTPSMIRVWDLPVRLFHWSLVSLLIAAWVTAENHMMEAHQWIGFSILTLVLFRIGWGLWGSETARFSHFLKGPSAIAAHLKSFFKGPYSPHLGHNPVGGLSIILLLAVMLGQGTMGLFTDDDIFFQGPLRHLVDDSTAQQITSLHHDGLNVILPVVGLHIFAVALYGFWRKDNLLGPMVTGYRSFAAQEPKQAGGARALLTLAGAAGIVYAVVTFI